MKTEKILILEDKKTNIASYYILQNNDEYVGLSDNTIKIGYFEGFELLLTTNYNVYQLKINRELISIFTKISEKHLEKLFNEGKYPYDNKWRYDFMISKLYSNVS
jgi:hypothetical protein